MEKTPLVTEGCLARPAVISLCPVGILPAVRFRVVDFENIYMVWTNCLNIFSRYFFVWLAWVFLLHCLFACLACVSIMMRHGSWLSRYGLLITKSQQNSWREFTPDHINRNYKAWSLSISNTFLYLFFQLFFCLVQLLHFLSCPYLLLAPSPDLCFPKPPFSER